jgi:DNA-binding ferritin-like protein
MTKNRRSSHRRKHHTRRKNSQKRNTRKYVHDAGTNRIGGFLGAEKKTHMVNTFFDMLHTIKLYHWNTKKYPEHKATDELYERLNEHIDKFVEVLLGKDASRIHHSKSHVTPCTNTQQIKKKIHDYQEFLLHMNQVLDPVRDTDLLNIRDEILADLNQFLYLLTLNGGGGGKF